jgi:SH3-like domain-containing protein
MPPSLKIIPMLSPLLMLMTLAAHAGDLSRCLGVEILKNDVNLRSKPVAEGPPAGRAAQGKRFPVEAVPQNEDWARITRGPDAGRHVSFSVARVVFLTEDPGCDQATASAETVGTRINVRSQASLSASVVATFDPGDALTVAPATGPWLRISWPEEHAGRFIHRDFVRLRLPMASTD